MSRIINSNTPVQQRVKILKLISETVMILKEQPKLTRDSNDLIAFVILSLTEIEKTLIQSITPWEKRGYWVKADQFRKEWKWVSVVKNKLLQTLTVNGWQQMPQEIEGLAEKLIPFEPLKRMKGIDFWKGAYSVLKNGK